MEELKLEPKIEWVIMIRNKITNTFIKTIKSSDFDLMKISFKDTVNILGKDNVKFIKCIEYYNDTSNIVGIE